MKRIVHRKRYPRRAVLGWLAAAPAAALAGRELLAQEDTGFENLDKLSEPEDEEDLRRAGAPLTEEARCLAESEDSLSRSERRALMEKMKGLEGALRKLRDFEIADDVEPALVFRPLAGGRRR